MMQIRMSGRQLSIRLEPLILSVHGTRKQLVEFARKIIAEAELRSG